ncbi:hypothetical protein CEN49_10850 [Fischerella thermalis CCMEE 5273]|nr:hypothetical protein CBP17_22220 [Fischerella thermalis WC114]PLZ05479.1 hypothetical protein CBP19_21900 [Fischerella thermalis WC1110]PLZ05683.1 hypothetical protein CBP18_20790 [Fischerella thermalis WC119]PLZ16432.1 hypothetical protein CBP30_22335 [Fischerella thermalis WC157]PLZ32127.1 hypothetical protein CBP28_05445 [Fischerella thermalis WC559]PLZ34870.1 hypothetical protein CBP10_04755 [Fischerella thermalis WC558]PLZ41882.1 hypothetical protein CBP27_04950 [Fischerella thermalis
MHRTGGVAGSILVRLGNGLVFSYGWNGCRWQRAKYDAEDGFKSVGLLESCSLTDLEHLKGYAADAPGLEGMPPSDEALRALVSADAQITHQMLQRVIPGWDVEAGVAAAPKFLEMPV